MSPNPPSPPWTCPRCGFHLYGNPLVIRRDVRQCCRCGAFESLALRSSTEGDPQP